MSTGIALRHLELRLAPLDRRLRQAIENRDEKSRRWIRVSKRGFYMTAQHARGLLDGLAQRAALPPFEPTADEREAEARLALEGEAPLLRLERSLSLERFESDAIVLCAAVEIDRDYEKLFGFLHDDLTCRLPSCDLLARLLSGCESDRIARLADFSRFGKLRRLHILTSHGDAPTELRRELRLNPAHLSYLLSGAGDPVPLSVDPGAVDLTCEPLLADDLDHARIVNLGRALAQGTVNVAGIWGPPLASPPSVARALARIAKRPLRRVHFCDPHAPCFDPRANVRDSILAAAHLGALLWMDVAELASAEWERYRGLIADALLTTNVPLILTGHQPWRPSRLLASHAYAEIALNEPGYRARADLWLAAAPELPSAQADALASRFRLAPDDVKAAIRVAQTDLRSNPSSGSYGECLDAACATVIRKSSAQYATIVEPRRGPDDLVLPADLHRQVLEIGDFYLASSRVYEDWGFGKLVTGRGGFKALFTGDSGTGKTLACEVIAGRLKLPLLKVDLSRIVSKWVGETEKNLEAVFREAEDSQAVLFFDEADSLFGKRGAVRNGSDRWANMEVGYLLQRLEDYFGLAVLASNFKEQVDPAFLRRFQCVLHFPAPGPPERMRIWRRALRDVPHDAALPLEQWSKLDMTGASIVAAAFTAAALAANAGAASVTASHLLDAVSRQYQRESRLLDRALLDSPRADLPRPVIARR